MTEFLKNNPMALRHCLLYEFFQGESVEEAFNEFSKVVGPDAINKEEFQFWFDQFEQGKFDVEKKPVTDIRNIFRNDKKALRVCVMYEWLYSMNLTEMMQNLSLKKEAFLVFPRYERFCKLIGDDVMEYREFDHWFYRFVNGEFDLDFERDESKKILELSDMPIDAMKYVVEYLNIFDRLALARTSSSFKTFVEDHKLFLKKLEFWIDDRTAEISVEDRYIITDTRGNGCLRRHRRGFIQHSDIIEGIPYWKKGIQDFSDILKYPKLHLEEFRFELDDSAPLDEITDAIEMPIQQLHVKKLIHRSNYLKALLKILPSLKPGYLATFDINIHKPDVSMVKEMVELEQWKQAKYFNMRRGRFVGPLFHLYHFKVFQVFYEKMSAEDFRQLKQMALKSPDFEKCAIQVDIPLPVNIIRNEFRDAIQITLNSYRYPIPRSTDYFQVEILDIGIKITRMKT